VTKMLAMALLLHGGLLGGMGGEAAGVDGYGEVGGCLDPRDSSGGFLAASGTGEPWKFPQGSPQTTLSDEPRTTFAFARVSAFCVATQARMDLWRNVWGRVAFRRLGQCYHTYLVSLITLVWRRLTGNLH
jgi:hypothetical protein